MRRLTLESDVSRYARAVSGNSSAVEHRLAKAGVEGSNPFSRSVENASKLARLGCLFMPCDSQSHGRSHASAPTARRDRRSMTAAPCRSTTLSFDTSAQSDAQGMLVYASSMEPLGPCVHQSIKSG